MIRSILNRLIFAGSSFLLLLILQASIPYSSHNGFVSELKFTEIKESKPNILLDVRYFGSDNFTGHNVPGYMAPKIFLTNEAAARLNEVVEMLEKQNLGIKIFDGYRPQKAVDSFVKWASIPSDTISKQQYYPNIAKSELFKQGYITTKSGHTRGSTLDLTLVTLSTGAELNMGTCFDYFGPESHPFSQEISAEALDNRMILRNAMMACGFVPLDTEWWHFTLANEPYPDTYFDFAIR